MPRNTKRSFLATEYRAAPRNRLRAQQVTIPAVGSVEITAQCPTQAELGDAPFFDLLVGFNPNVINTGLVGVCVTDDPAVLDILYPYTGEEETEGIRVRGLFPWNGVAGAGIGLDTPLRVNQLLPASSPGNRILNRVFILNDQAQGEVNVEIVFEIPDLDWS